ncbi:MAG: carboxypeptidase regulatory-like domain-containing protein, partial [Candidatus Riflebacteria bacterium]|nr:carboxypeptidase regulatory-like domain-containing protein [Candidatus Riflebacteria bacterium]
MRDSKKRPILLLFLIITFVSIWFFTGCGPGPVGVSGTGGLAQAPVATGNISGRIISTGTVGLNVLSNAKVLGSGKGVANAEVWVQQDFDRKTYTDSDGFFTISDIPLGNYQIVASYTSNGQILKVRSTEIGVQTETPTGKTGELELYKASNRVQGILRDDNGKPLANATVYLWGEPVKTDENGYFLSPPLPDSVSSETITVAASGYNDKNISVPLSSDGKSTVDEKMVTIGSSKPDAIVGLFCNKLQSEKVLPGSKVLAWGVFQDKNGNTSSMNGNWEITGGTLASSNVTIPTIFRGTDFNWNLATVETVEWTLPPQSGNFNIKFINVSAYEDFLIIFCNIFGSATKSKFILTLAI